jgi:hypothetical protein
MIAQKKAGKIQSALPLMSMDIGESLNGFGALPVGV